MPKFFVPKENIFENKIKITGEDVAHITRVLRMTKGEKLCLCDGAGNNYDAVISEIDAKKIECTIESKEKAGTEANIEVTLFQGIPKGSKMEYIIQKTTELGIVRIVPCQMARSVSKIDAKDSKKKQVRWQKIAEEAAKQSGRGIIPEVLEPVGFDEALKMMGESDLAFAPYECEENNSIKTTLLAGKSAKTISFMIGPEGGYDIAEIEKLKDKNIKTVTLGKRILRTETAGEAVLAMIMYELGDIND